MHGREVTVPCLKTMAKWHLWQLWELIEGGKRRTSSFWMVMCHGIKVWHKLVKSLSDLVFVVRINGFESAVASFRKTKASPPEGNYIPQGWCSQSAWRHFSQIGAMPSISGYIDHFFWAAISTCNVFPTTCDDFQQKGMTFASCLSRWLCAFGKRW